MRLAARAADASAADAGAADAGAAEAGAAEVESEGVGGEVGEQCEEGAARDAEDIEPAAEEFERARPVM